MHTKSRLKIKGISKETIQEIKERRKRASIIAWKRVAKVFRGIKF